MAWTLICSILAGLLLISTAEYFEEGKVYADAYERVEFEYHTTNSWDFLLFDDRTPRNMARESDVIIGVIDSGIWPVHDSFRDDGLGPPPSKWKGPCQKIQCNNKIIGARYYPSFAPYCSPRDYNGHGTHVASIAAGQNVYNAEMFGLGKGTARGAVPTARIAVYKICTFSNTNIMQAFIDAVADGVDIISISLGSVNGARDYTLDGIAKGAFHAMKHGVLTSAAAGNSGPKEKSLSNVAPWLLSVAATTTDRKIVTQLALTDGKLILGTSINSRRETGPIYYLGEIERYPPRSCYEATDDDLFQDHIVFCSGPFSANFKLRGARGAIVLDDSREDLPTPNYIPTVYVNSSFGRIIWDYIYIHNDFAEATINTSQVVIDDTAPAIASFSSRGPNIISPSVLKPDISAPGVSILAAWPSWNKSNVNMVSGTSMACPHVSGIAAYVKSMHPTWSPAAIMSALITTAAPMDTSYVHDAEFSYGAGLLNPVWAPYPGLIFDAGVEDYKFLLCSQGYSDVAIRHITREDYFSCSDLPADIEDFNYPSMAIQVDENKNFTTLIKRTVTNVGDANSVYTWRVTCPGNIKVSVEPQAGFTFTKLGEKQSFQAVISGELLKPNSVASAALTLQSSDYYYEVRFPIIVYNY